MVVRFMMDVILILVLSSWSLHTDAELSPISFVSKFESIDGTTKFMDADRSNDLAQQASRSRSRNLDGYMDIYVDGSETMYNEYSQAYRYMGLYVECTVNEGEDDGRRRRQIRRQRQLDQDGDQVDENDAGDGDDVQEGNNDEEENHDQQHDAQDGVEEGLTCQRYILWAAYVDLGYSGDGLAYSFYNHRSGRWNSQACKTLGTRRCVRMDCHQANSNFELLGFFKQADPLDWLKTLISHQGSCLYSDDEYNAMMESINYLPNGCTDSGVQTEDGYSNIYFDLEPSGDGGIDIELFMDAGCSQRYRGMMSRDYVLMIYYENEDENDDGSVTQIDVDSTVSTVNKLLEPFKTCQPCRTYDLDNKSSANNDDNDDGNNNNDDDDGSDPYGGYFVCNDAAGDSGINQCNMFKENTEMDIASFSDVTKAVEQGSIVTNTYADIKLTFWQADGFFIFSTLVFIIGLIFLGVVLGPGKKRRRIGLSKDEPLIFIKGSQQSNEEQSQQHSQQQQRKQQQKQQQLQQQQQQQQQQHQQQHGNERMQEL